MRTPIETMFDLVKILDNNHKISHLIFKNNSHHKIVTKQLNFLIKKGFVEKVNQEFFLTENGQEFRRLII